MKHENTVGKDTKTQLVKAAPLAVSGALGAEFWDEVERLDLARGALKKVSVEPRKTRDY
jgi:hypothetical protein